MRAPIFRGFALLPGELVVDNFAGGGGASTGIEAAIGRPVDIAINHDAEAIAMHKANHPETRHYCENIWEVDPREAAAGRPVGIAWFSPDCTHFSRAKGGQPRKKEIRALAGVVIRWAKAVAPRLILLENVEEFQTWGPLDDEGYPIPERAGETFREWLAELTACGYSVEFKSLVAADYGTPTTRKRLFLVARRDGSGISWPDATHGAGRSDRWRPAAEIIDWSLPCPSIFDRKRPLADATMKRIAAGIQRYVIGSRQPFVMAAHRGDISVVDPFLVRTAHGDVDRRGKRRGRGDHDLRAPLPTVLASNDFAVCEPFIVRHGHVSTITGLGDTMRGQRLDKPLATVCATNDKHLVAPIITKHYGGVVGHGVERTIGTITAADHHALSAAFLMKYHGTFRGQGVDQPMLTVDTRDRFAEVRTSLRDARGQEMDEPLRTLDTSNRFAEVRAFLTKFYGTATAGSSLQLPFPTVTSGGGRGGGHLGLVMVAGQAYEIVDIGMRMLQPHELFAAQGFPDDYDIAPEFNGKPLSKTAQTALAGNSVCPQVAEALVLANTRDAAREAA
jgi:DNA (cytosine-5)-methyltransferase 1